jgi:integrase
MRGIPPERAAATRRHVAQLLHRLCAMAVFPLRLIAASPLPRGFLPKVGAGKAKGWIYPDEDARLLASAEVPLEWRVFYGFLHREGLRRSEAARLTWRDFDLERGSVTLDENKTDDPRAWALSPGVAAALRAWLEVRAREGAELGLGNWHEWIWPWATTAQFAPLARYACRFANSSSKSSAKPPAAAGSSKRMSRL